MDAKVISKERIVDLLDDLIEQYEVLAPVRNGSNVLFDRISTGHEAILDSANTRTSPKAVFFPQEEVLFVFDGVEAEMPVAVGARVLFGVRPCDAQSFLVLDKVFNAAEYPTVYYGRQRERTYVVGIGCTHPRSTCFCTALEGEPFAKEGLDVLLSDIGDKYVVEVLSEKGELLLEGNALLQRATESDLCEKERIAREAREAANVNLTKIKSHIVEGKSIFFIEFNGHKDDAHIKPILERYQDEIKVLGSYVKEIDDI